MATKSITKQIAIKIRSAAADFYNALQQAQNKKTKDVVISKKCRELKGEDIKKFLGDI